MKNYFNGTVAPVLVPCGKDGKIDKEAFVKHIRFLADHGISGVFIGGTSGEFINYSNEERREQLKLACDNSKGMDVLYNITAMNLEEMQQHIEYARSLNVNCISVTAPYYHKYDAAALAEYFAAVSERTEDMVMFIYNMPNMTGNPVTPELIDQLRKRCPNLKGIKDSSMNFTNLQELIIDAPDGFEVITGNDAEILASIEMGCKGSIVALANCFPEICSGIYRYYSAGDVQTAKLLQKQIIKFRKACRGTLPIMSHKYLLELRGRPMGKAHFPMRELNESEKKRLTETYASVLAEIKHLGIVSD